MYLISGDEPLLTAEATDAVRARARTDGFTEREVLVLDRGADWEAVRATVSSLSLFAARRIVELKLPTGKAGVAGGRALADAIEAAGGDTLLIIQSGRLDREAQNAPWVRAAEVRGAWIPVWPIPSGEMVPWLDARCRRLGLAVDPQGLEVLAEHTQGNLLAAQQELEKLKLLGGETRVSAERMLSVITDGARFTVNELTEALLAGELARSLRILGGLQTEGAELPLVLWAVTRAVRELWARRAGGPPRGHGPHGAAGPQRSARLARLPFGRIVARAVRADAFAKGRLAGDAWAELALIACELCGRPALALSPAGIQ